MTGRRPAKPSARHGIDCGGSGANLVGVGLVSPTLRLRLRLLAMRSRAEVPRRSDLYRHGRESLLRHTRSEVQGLVVAGILTVTVPIAARAGKWGQLVPAHQACAYALTTCGSKHLSSGSAKLGHARQAGGDSALKLKRHGYGGLGAKSSAAVHWRERDRRPGRIVLRPPLSSPAPNGAPLRGCGA